MAFRLPRLPDDVPIADAKTGKPTFKFQRWWQSFIKTIETQEANQDALLAAVIAAQDAATQAQIAADLAQGAADNAQTAADAADTAASTAQASADGANSVASLTASGTSGLTLTATDAGASATITISAHTRIYGDGSSVAVSGGSLTGRAYSTDYSIYYDDPTRAGGAVTYQSTTTPADAVQAGDRHLVGVVTTPAAAAPPNNGDVVRPPGYGNIEF